MHELSVCRALLDEILKIAARHDAVRVTTVRLRIGPLSGVEPALLTAAYPLVAAGTCAEQAVLQISGDDVRMRCKQCGRETCTDSSHLCCGACGALDTELASGDALMLESLELVRSEAAQDVENDAHV